MQGSLEQLIEVEIYLLLGIQRGSLCAWLFARRFNGARARKLCAFLVAMFMTFVQFSDIFAVSILFVGDGF